MKARLCRRLHVGHEGGAQPFQLDGVLVLDVSTSAEILRHDDIGVFHPVLIGQDSTVVDGLLGVVLTSHHHYIIGKVLMSSPLEGDVRPASVDDDLRHPPLLGVVCNNRCEHQSHVGPRVERVHVQVEPHHHAVVSVLHLDILHRDRSVGELRPCALCLRHQRCSQQTSAIYR